VTTATIAAPNEPSIAVLIEALVRAVAPLEDGTLLTFDAIHKIIFEDPQSARGRNVIRGAIRRLVVEQNRLLVNVRAKGYQVTQQKEHTVFVDRQTKYGRRRYRWALTIATHTELSKLTPAERQQIEEQANRVRLALALTMRLRKMAVPAKRSEIHMPSGKQLAGLLKKNPQ
jgi:hypothetical protein